MTDFKKNTPVPQCVQTVVMPSFILKYYYKLKIKHIEKKINKVELYLYFDGYSGKQCIDLCNYYLSKIDNYKLKIFKL